MTYRPNIEKFAPLEKASYVKIQAGKDFVCNNVKNLAGRKPNLLSKKGNILGDYKPNKVYKPY